MRVMQYSAIALLVAAVLVGCGGGEVAPDKVFENVSHAVADGKPQAIWEAMPASYQKDVNDLGHDFAGKMDKELWDKAFVVAQKALRLLEDKEKRDYLLKSPLMARAPVSADQANANAEDAIKLLSTLVNSDISSLDKLKTLDVGAFLSGTGADLMKQSIAIAKAVPDQSKEYVDSLEKLKGVKATIVKTEGDKAIVKVETKGEEPMEQEFVKVEGKWVPKELADVWKSEIAEAKQELSKISGDALTAQKPMIMGGLTMVEGALDQLLGAKNEEEFNAVLGNLPNPTAPPESFSLEKAKELETAAMDKASYTVAFNLAKRMQSDGVPLHEDAFGDGVFDAFSGESSRINQEEMTERRKAFQNRLSERGSNPDASQEPPDQKLSYSIGFGFGNRMKADGVPLDEDSFRAGTSDAIKGVNSRLTPEEMDAATKAQQGKASAARIALGEANRASSVAFLQENGARPAVVTTTSGLQYEIIREGTGRRPEKADTIEAHYRGTLVDGTEFDSSYKRGASVTFGVGQVIPGWTEALLLMPVGSKWILTIPAELAYGVNGAGEVIGPNAAIRFEVELLSIK